MLRVCLHPHMVATYEDSAEGNFLMFTAVVAGTPCVNNAFAEYGRVSFVVPEKVMIFVGSNFI